MVKVESTTAVQAEFIRHLLEEEGIECMIQENPEWIEIYMGPATYANSIFVDESDEERAKAIIAGFHQSKIRETDLSGGDAVRSIRRRILQIVVVAGLAAFLFFVAKGLVEFVTEEMM